MKKLAIPLSLVSVLACSFAGNALCAAPTTHLQTKHKHAAVAQNKQLKAKKYHAVKYRQGRQPTYAVTSAMAIAPIHQFTEFKLKPRVSVWGLSGSYTSGKGQVLFPLSGDQSRAFFALAEGDANTNSTWFAGAGLGYRQIANNMLYGGYLIADYTQSRDNNGYWIANPGVEVFGTAWEFNANAYIAINNKKKEYSTVRWADEFGIYRYIEHTAHTQYNRHAERNDFESAGQGADFKIGRTIPGLDSAKLYVGGYYFKNEAAGHVTGGLVKATYDINKYVGLEATDSYDNYNHNKVMLGVKVTLGGYNKQEKQEFGLSSRLTDTIDHGYITTIVPIKKITGDVRIIDSGISKEVQYDNIWFFDPHGSYYPVNNSNSSNDYSYGEDGTFEHPFTHFNPTNIQYVTGHYAQFSQNMPRLYVEGPSIVNLSEFIGAPLPNSNGMGGLIGKFLLPEGWGIYGRTNEFQYAAQNNDRPVFIGGIDLWHDDGTQRSNNQVERGGHNVLDSIIVREVGEVADRGMGVLYMHNVEDVNLRNTTIGSEVNGQNSYHTGIFMENSVLNLQDSQVFATISPFFEEETNDGYSHAAVAITATSGSEVNFNGGNLVQASSTDADDKGGTHLSYRAIGIDANDSSSVNFLAGENKVVAVTSCIRQEISSLYSYGIIADNSLVHFLGGKNSVVGNSDVSLSMDTSAYSYGISAEDNAVVKFEKGANTVEAKNSSTDPRGGNHMYAYGLAVSGATIAFGSEPANSNDVDENTINATNTGDLGYNSNFLAAGIYQQSYYGIADNIYFYSGKNKVNALNSSPSGTSSWLYAYGIRFDYNNQNNSTIQFLDGTNDIAASNTSSSNGNVYLYSEGIGLSDNVALVFEDGQNTITARNTGTARDYIYEQAFGIRLDNYAYVDFIDGTNRVIAENICNLGAGGSNSGNAYLYGWGIYAQSSSQQNPITFTGGENTISVSNVANGSNFYTDMTAEGIQNGYNYLTFAGGKNRIEVSNSGNGVNSNSKFHTYGIDNQYYGVVNFLDSSTDNTIVVSTSGSASNQEIYGIKSTYSSWYNNHLEINGTTVTNLSDLLDYVTIDGSNRPATATGYMIEGNGMTLAWPPLSSAALTQTFDQQVKEHFSVMNKYDDELADQLI